MTRPDTVRASSLLDRRYFLRVGGGLAVSGLLPQALPAAPCQRVRVPEQGARPGAVERDAPALDESERLLQNRDGGLDGAASDVQAA